MATYIFIGANSDIAKSVISSMGDDHSLILLTRNPEKIPDEIMQQHKCLKCNPCDFNDVTNCFEEATQDNIISGVVNFCGSVMLKPAGSLSENEWHDTININLNTAFNVAHATAKYIKKDCCLILFSTAAASIGLPNHEAISAAKAGVESLAKSVAASYAKQNIRCNVIAPGLVETNLTSAITKSEKGRELSLSLHGLSRLGKPQDIANMVSWLLDEENNWITGETFRIDGGLSTIKCY